MPHENGSGSRNRHRWIERTLVAMLCLSLWVLSSLGCGSKAIRLGTERTVCSVLDSLYRTSGFEKPLTLHGKATIDAKQRRVRGKIRVDARPPDQFVFEFTSSILFGSQREDFVFSLVADTLRIIDRERGEYYEADDADRMLREMLETDLAIKQVVSLATGGRPSCDDMTDLGFRMGSKGRVVFTGRYGGESFRVVFAAGHRRLEEITWPLLLEGRAADRLRVIYDWEATKEGNVALRGIVMSVETKEWRCKIRSSGTG
ncbi:MAG: hypothetical protein JSW58_12340 [Candidatus Latescibacterota bacterium]|nr:MAG: hypothetical protein JSW58_12340 [Candidatus Latescibacterota bacterium]